MGFDNTRMYKKYQSKITVEFYCEISNFKLQRIVKRFVKMNIYIYSSRQHEVPDELLKLFQCTDIESDESIDSFN